MLAIACLSQKGGVGKSTLARLMAQTYAKGSWRVKIADFNVKQKTSVDWAALRMSQQVIPEIAAEAYTDVTKAMKMLDIDLLVVDGKPDSDTQTHRIAQDSNLIVIPTGCSADDLVPQLRFAHELMMRGIPAEKLLFVLNKATDSPAAIADARTFIKNGGFETAETALPMKTGYMNAHNQGRCLAETEFASLNDRASCLAQEIVDRLNKLTGTANG
jgi:chromosome partitioning protein